MGLQPGRLFFFLGCCCRYWVYCWGALEGSFASWWPGRRPRLCPHIPPNAFPLKTGCSLEDRLSAPHTHLFCPLQINGDGERRPFPLLSFSREMLFHATLGGYSSVLPGGPLSRAAPHAPRLSVCLPMQSSGNASYRCSMSSSADFSDEEDYSQRSGTVSPAPGDTLPWNLPKHERSKRKIQGGSVLDPAERAVLRIAGKARPGLVGWRESRGTPSP